MRCPSCRMIVSPNAVSCPACGRLLVAPEQVVEGTVVVSSSTTIPIPDTDATTASVPDERPNRLARQRPRATIIGSLARFVQDAWNEPVVRVAASAALIALGERLADRLAGAERGRRTQCPRACAISAGATNHAPRRRMPVVIVASYRTPIRASWPTEAMSAA